MIRFLTLIIIIIAYNCTARPKTGALVLLFCTLVHQFHILHDTNHTVEHLLVADWYSSFAL